MDPITLRIVERIIAVVIGGLSMYFGYRLLMKEPKQAKSKATLTLPGGISIDLSRVGPGVFFALFGAIVVALSLYHTVTYSVETTIDDPAAGTEQKIENFSGIGSTQQVNRETERNLLEQKIIFINKTLPTVLRTDLSDEQQVGLEIDIEKFKLDLMKVVWDDGWGDYDKFEEVVRTGALDDAPPELQAAVEYFRQGLEE